MYYSKFNEAGFHTIYDFFDDNNTIKSIANDDRFNTIDVLKWYGLAHAIPKQWRDSICIKGLRKPGVFEYGMRLSNSFVSISNITSKHSWRSVVCYIPVL